jgi:hypothetical protein
MKNRYSDTYTVIKRKTYLLLDPSVNESIWDYVASGIIVSLIALNVLAVILETVESLYADCLLKVVPKSILRLLIPIKREHVSRLNHLMIFTSFLIL